MMLPVAAMPVAAQSCILSNVASEKMCKRDCCANKSCCATSPKTAAPVSQPLGKTDSSYPLNATCVGLATAVVPSWDWGAREFSFSNTVSGAHSPPTLELICIRLI
jgi:hypothetical protein